jgi:uncharacterized membrane protein YgaE (UPF0421/DUF939 family)
MLALIYSLTREPKVAIALLLSAVLGIVIGAISGALPGFIAFGVSAFSTVTATLAQNLLNKS